MLAAIPLVLFHGLCIAAQLSLFRACTGLTVSHVTEFAVRASAVLLSSLWMVFLLARRTPIGKSPDLMPRIDALLCTYLPLGTAFLPVRHLPWQVSVTAAFLALAGIIFCIYCILYLGRSISIMPEARRLVTGGPYRFVRHPLYLGESVALLGTVIRFLSPMAILLFTLQLGFFFQRMRHEESVLGANFADYAAYAARTARLIPGLL